MKRVLEAVYENGVLKPLENPGLSEHQRVVVELRDPPVGEAANQTLVAWEEVYEGLSSEEIAEVEHEALNRSNFCRNPS